MGVDISHRWVETGGDDMPDAYTSVPVRTQDLPFNIIEVPRYGDEAARQVFQCLVPPLWSPRISYQLQQTVSISTVH